MRLKPEAVMEICTCGTNAAHAVNCPVYYNRQKQRIAELEAKFEALTKCYEHSLEKFSDLLEQLKHEKAEVERLKGIEKAASEVTKGAMKGRYQGDRYDTVKCHLIDALKAALEESDG